MLYISGRSSIDRRRSDQLCQGARATASVSRGPEKTEEQEF